MSELESRVPSYQVLLQPSSVAHLQAEGRRDTATNAGDPSPFKAFAARAAQLDTCDNHTFC